VHRAATKPRGPVSSEHAPARGPGTAGCHTQQNSGGGGQASRAEGAEVPGGRLRRQEQPALQQFGDLRGPGLDRAKGIPCLYFMKMASVLVP
jgi:hypothetical protein